MADVIGKIEPAADVDIQPATGWEMPTVVRNIFDTTGMKRGRIEWVGIDVDQEFFDALNHLCAVAMRARARVG